MCCVAASLWRGCRCCVVFTAGIRPLIAYRIYFPSLGQLAGDTNAPPPEPSQQEKIPVENLDTVNSAAPYFLRKDLVSPVVVAPSGGTVQRAIRFRDELGHLGVESEYFFLALAPE